MCAFSLLTQSFRLGATRLHVECVVMWVVLLVITAAHLEDTMRWNTKALAHGLALCTHKKATLSAFVLEHQALEDLTTGIAVLPVPTGMTVVATTMAVIHPCLGTPLTPTPNHLPPSWETVVAITLAHPITLARPKLKEITVTAITAVTTTLALLIHTEVVIITTVATLCLVRMTTAMVAPTHLRLATGSRPRKTTLAQENNFGTRKQL